MALLRHRLLRLLLRFLGFLHLLRVNESNPSVILTLYRLVIAAGVLLIATTPRRWRMSWLMYILAIIISIVHYTAIGSAAIILAATLISVGPAWNERSG